MIGLLIVHSVP